MKYPKLNEFDDILWWPTEEEINTTEGLANNKYKTLSEILDLMYVYIDTTAIDGKVHFLVAEEIKGRVVINEKTKTVTFTDGELTKILQYEEDDMRQEAA